MACLNALSGKKIKYKPYRLNLQIEHQLKIIQLLTNENEHLQAVNKGQREALFGRSSEKQILPSTVRVFACKQTVVYVVDASRAASVLLKHFGEDVQGMVSSDRFSAFVMLSRQRKGIINSFCWAHFRRDYIKACKEYKDLQVWSEQWLARIR